MRDMVLQGKLVGVGGLIKDTLLYYTTTYNLGELLIQFEIAKEGEQGAFVTVKASDLIDMTDVLRQMPDRRISS